MIKDGFELINKEGQDYICSKTDRKAEIPVSVFSAFLWNNFKDLPLNKGQMLEKLLADFDISTVLALGEIDNFLRMLRENGIIE